MLSSSSLSLLFIEGSRVIFLLLVKGLMLLCQLFLEKLCLGLLFQFSFKNSTVLPTESVLFSFTLLSSNSLLFLELGDSGIGQFFEFLVVGLRYDLPHSGPVWWHFS